MEGKKKSAGCADQPKGERGSDAVTDWSRLEARGLVSSTKDFVGANQAERAKKGE